MPFNRWTYYANKYEREARADLALAREIKAGKHPDALPDAVKRLVRCARESWRLSRWHRAAK